MGPSYGKYLVSGILVALALLIPSMINDAYASMPISSCGTLDIPGETYVLSKDLTSSGTCFTITRGGITLDGNGHTITGSDSLYGVNVRTYATGATVKNLNISGFGTGIYVTASDVHVIGNTVANIGWAGIRASNSCGVTITENTVHSSPVGIFAQYSTGIKIDRNNVDGNSQNGIRVSAVDGFVITGNSAITTTASRGIIIQSSNDGFLVDNTASGNEAILLHNSHNNTLINNTVEFCSDCNSFWPVGVTGIMIWESNGNTLIKNSVEAPHLRGIYLTGSDNNTLLENVISNHNKDIASYGIGLLIINSHANTFN